MKITKVEPIALRVPEIKEPVDGNEDDLLVRIETDEGFEGIGEIDGPPIALAPFIRTVHPGTWWRGFEDLLVGENPLEIERIWEKMYRYSYLYGRSGLIMTVISGLDNALWDLAGKYYKQPVYRLLGGAGKRNSGVVTPYASIYPFGPTEDDVIEKCNKYVKKRGYIAVKFHNHPIGTDDEQALKFVKRAREELGDDIALMLDAAFHFETPEAIKFARSIEPFDIYFLESPLHPDNLNGYAKLSQSTSVLIASGEELTLRQQFVDLMDRGRVDIIQPDTVWVGGITEWKRIARLAHSKGVLCIPHCFRSNITLAANLHASAAVPNSPYAESPLLSSPLARELTNEKFEPGRDGRIKLPDKPGLGITLNKKTLEKYRFDVSEFRYDAPARRRSRSKAG
jgi:L-alanine-DL-glutamate epimerase-like enolase superfamily enzyme